MEFFLLLLLVAAGILLLILFFYFIPVGLWISALAARVHIGIGELIGMRLRRVPPRIILGSQISATKAGLDISTAFLEAHFLASNWTHPPCRPKAMRSGAYPGFHALYRKHGPNSAGNCPLTLCFAVAVTGVFFSPMTFTLASSFASCATPRKTTKPSSSGWKTAAR